MWLTRKSIPSARPRVRLRARSPIELLPIVERIQVVAHVRDQYSFQFLSDATYVLFPVLLSDCRCALLVVPHFPKPRDAMLDPLACCPPVHILSLLSVSILRSILLSTLEHQLRCFLCWHDVRCGVLQPLVPFCLPCLVELLLQVSSCFVALNDFSSVLHWLALAERLESLCTFLVIPRLECRLWC